MNEIPDRVTMDELEWDLANKEWEEWSKRLYWNNEHERIPVLPVRECMINATNLTTLEIAKLYNEYMESGLYDEN